MYVVRRLRYRAYVILFCVNPLKSITIASVAIMAIPACADSLAATKAEIDVTAMEALKQFSRIDPKHKNLERDAEAALIFPRVTKGGVGIAGGYGEGLLLIKGKIVGYFSLSSASVGLTVGAEKHKEIILFMTPQALNRFTSSIG